MFSILFILLLSVLRIYTCNGFGLVKYRDYIYIGIDKRAPIIYAIGMD